MERNEGQDGSAGTGASNANEFSGSGSQQQGESFDFSGTTGTASSESVRDRAKNALGSAGERLSDVGSNLRERAGGARDKLVGALEAGADKLRERSGTGALAGATADGSVALQSGGKMAQVNERVATGMQATADFLRDADLDNLKSGIERQVKEHPGRTLLIAAGLGYLIGRAFRNR